MGGAHFGEGPPTPAAWQLFLSLGILGCFGVSSLAQESLKRNRYDGEQFRSENFLVWIQSCAAVLAAFVAIAVGRIGAAKSTFSVPPPSLHVIGTWILVVAAYYASHWFGLASLNYLSYPMHVTFKSCKAIPVVIGERVLTGRRHSPAENIGVVAMCVGVAVFILCGKNDHESGATSVLGIALVVAALVADGLYAGSQVTLVQRCESPYVLMMHMNAWQGVLALGALVSARELAPALSFIRAHPAILRELTAFVLSKALGTICVYRLLRDSGTLVVATVTTLRKVLSVLLSVVAFGHTLNPLQWLALALIFLHKYFGRYAADCLSERQRAADATTTAQGTAAKKDL